MNILFTPLKDTIYSLSFHDQVWELPKAENEGWVLNVDPLSKFHVRIEIQKSRSIEDRATLLLFRRGVLLYSASVHLFNPAVSLPETDQNGKAKVTFKTSDIPEKYVIKVTAFSKEGSLEETT